MEEQGYQGWTNWDTWATVLWAFNEEPNYRRIIEEKPDTIEEVQRLVYSMIVKDPVVFDNVNWEEVLWAFKEHYNE